MSGTAVVLGVGPGLGMSIAHRFGREGYRVALVSRSATRHPDYLAALAAAGVQAGSHTADVRDAGSLRAALDEIGRVDVLYYGPASADISPVPITETSSDDVREAMSWVLPAVDAVGAVLPGMVERGSGGLLFAGGLSAVVPMPPLGNLAVSSAALRNYALTLNAALAGTGVYAGALTIGGLIERGDIHRMMTAQPELLGDLSAHTLDPDGIADAAWELYTKRDRAEEVFNALG
ncbi:SDR family NAD(P)-dependent oxidoreductase [Saccharothrix coeruleofusca]|uniref:Short-chain dehydrogenase n=1 Tax=Saccharothrix coeruleofusca TaxID=33919 RepID=A0A918ECG4_9PSEU|nr:SDR family NAD(P)-dependent oxidoreductase [Saccharothrix coeruleofusca]GGP49512.1 short-chain dehydrogenase [Saccharothrix coeruleofusca]